MGTQATVSNSVAGHFRYVVLFLWVLACAVLGWVALTDQHGLGRIVWGIFSVVGSSVLIFTLQQESALASNHAVAYAEVVSYHPRRGRWSGGPESRYRFEALDGRSYEGRCGIKSQPGNRIYVLYNPLMPAKNKAADGFFFYRFDLPKS